MAIYKIDEKTMTEAVKKLVEIFHQENPSVGDYKAALPNGTTVRIRIGNVVPYQKTSTG